MPYCPTTVIRRRLRRPFVSILFATAVFASPKLYGQVVDRITEGINPAKLVTVTNHHPQWANKENDTGLMAADLPLEQLTLVLSRSPQQEEALQTFLAEQQDLSSPNYHHWLTPVEMGERFGLSQQDIATLSDWLQSQGLHVNWVSPSHMFIRFGGPAGAIGRAFQTEFHTYKSNDTIERMSVSSDPMIPLALAPAIKAVHGLYTVENHPFHNLRPMQSDEPNVTSSNGEHFIVPADVAAIYDYNGGTPAPETIAIVGRSRTNFNDFAHFRQLTETNFANPIEIVPTRFGGVDPGPALTAPPAGNVSLDDQSEATLDVAQAAGVDGNAQILLVVATEASGGIEADAQYLVQTSPVPAPVMSISFGACESAAGPSGVAFWDTLFQQAAAEGISVFVASGDSGASGCDEAFATPPATPLPNSPNYICSSSYATCVGGTEFNDTPDPAQYWSTDSNRNLASALTYIPEGGWNEPQNSSDGPQVAASGGGVSSVIPTPVWQTGAGVPAARSGRYTPDVAFSAANHDGYFGCMAAAGGTCVAGANGSFPFVVFSGTSASAPLMAGIAALLDGEVGAPQGTLNPQLYQLAATTPAVFHDVTVASSGVASCALTTPSMCNSSIPGSTGQSGGHAGYTVTAGYDQVTGLGSLDILNFLESFPAPPDIKVLLDTPGLAFPSQLLGFPTQAQVGFQNRGSAPLDPLSITITGADANDFSLVNDCQSALAAQASCMVQVTFTPSAVGARTATMTVTSANAGSSPTVVSLSGAGTTTLYAPTVSVTPSSTTINTAQALTATVMVAAPPGVPATSTGAPIVPSGSVRVTGGGYTSPPTILSGNNAIVDIPAGSMALGNIVLTAAYIPDTASSAIYSGASGTTLVTVTTVMPPGFIIQSNSVTIAPGATTGNSTVVAVSPTNGFTGSIALSAAITSAPAGAQHLPTFSFGNTSPVNIANLASGGATLTVLSTAPVDANRISWYAGGGMSLAWLLMLGVPKRSRRWRAMLGMVLLLVSLSGAMTACGGSSGGSGSSTSASGSTSDPGTTAGTYVVTITGTAGTTTATGTVSVRVQ
jgi:Pro-kumamolisin, activation domain